ncbi:hypothetical protein TH24_06245 [Thalassospira xiamenensis]|nr:hypothetical protein TH24_06245 [Thalassospira xiamenensis]
MESTIAHGGWMWWRWGVEFRGWTQLHQHRIANNRSTLFVWNSQSPHILHTTEEAFNKVALRV